MSASRVSFVVPVLNDAERLDRCLRSIALTAGDAACTEVIVVDNGSRDDSANVARLHGAHVITLNLQHVAELRNAGAAAASGEILAFVDADHQISANWTSAALETFTDQGVAAAGALCDAPANGTWVQRAYGALRGSPRGRHDVEWLGSGNMAVRRSAFVLIGGFDTSLATCEDVDLCNRLRSAGHRIVSDARMQSVHFGDPATLRDVVAGELWRGRDNLRVSLRGAQSWRALPSIILPMVDAALLAVAALGVVIALVGATAGLAIVAASVLAVVAGGLLRVSRAVVRERRLSPGWILQAWVVSCAYDAGRALALFMRVHHRAGDGRTVAVH
jgi:GT2 family glycosyltransferase